jgi:ankyrin repeat protein
MNKKKHFIMLLLAIWLNPISANIYAENSSFCESYATKASSQYATNVKAGCGFSDTRWNANTKGQKEWCESVRENIALNETKTRANDLLQCFNQIAAGAETYLSKTPNQLGQALIQAAKNNELSTFKQLLAAGADLSYEEMKGNDGTALFHAIVSGSEDIVRFLIHLGQNPNTTFNGGHTPLSSTLNNLPLLEYLLQNGADPNYPGELYDHDYLPLVVAVRENNTPALTLLLKYGADPNQYDMRSPLQIAVTKQSLPITELLLTYGAKPNNVTLGQTCTEKTPLDIATERQDMAMQALLKRHGAQLYTECRQ